MINKIKSDSLEARKKNDEVAKSLLNILLSDILKEAKDDGNREPTDTDCLKIIKKFLKANNETKNLIQDEDALQKLKIESDILERYLPQQISESELKNIIIDLLKCVDDKNIGSMMKLLKEKYDGQFDAKKASMMIKELISN
jgi:uncharacterized protein YqeY